MMILVIRAIIAQCTNFLCKCLVVCHSCTCIAQCTEILAGIKAEASCVTKRANSLAFVCGSMCLCTILHNIQAMLFCNFHNRSHIAGLAVQMDWHNGFCLFGNLILNSGWINIKGTDIGLHKNRRCSGIGNRQCSCNKGIGRHDHLIACMNIQRLQCKHQRIQAVSCADTIIHMAEVCKSLFKCFVFLSLDIPAALINALKRCAQLSIQLMFHRQKTYKRYIHDSFSPSIPVVSPQFFTNSKNSS